MLTGQQRDVLGRLEESLVESYTAMCTVYPDAHQAAAALHCTRAEMERALSPLYNSGPLAWMQTLPIAARTALRKLGMTIF